MKAMDTKNLRKIHLYLGCLFAPALLFFIISGCWQTFRLNEAKKDSNYTPAVFVQVLSAVHTSQTASLTTEGSSAPFKIFVLAMTGALLATIILGVILAFQVCKKQSWVVWACLILGVILPIFLLRMR